MEPKEFQVEVISRQRTYYHISAEDAEGAQRIAAERWHRGEPSDLRGIEMSELESVRAAEQSEAAFMEQDDQLLLRFIREREKLLIKLGNNLLDPSVNDAISAAQASADLGWVKTVAAGAGFDLQRAAMALERLCERKLLVCFERARFRAGERGEIRLYCTPEYLERLSEATLSGSTQPAAR